MSTRAAGQQAQIAKDTISEYEFTRALFTDKLDELFPDATVSTGTRVEHREFKTIKVAFPDGSTITWELET